MSLPSADSDSVRTQEDGTERTSNRSGAGEDNSITATILNGNGGSTGGASTGTDSGSGSSSDGGSDNDSNNMEDMSNNITTALTRSSSYQQPLQQLGRIDEDNDGLAMDDKRWGASTSTGGGNAHMPSRVSLKDSSGGSEIGGPHVHYSRAREALANSENDVCANQAVVDVGILTTAMNNNNISADDMTTLSSAVTEATLLTNPNPAETLYDTTGGSVILASIQVLDSDGNISELEDHTKRHVQSTATTNTNNLTVPMGNNGEDDSDRVDSEEASAREPDRDLLNERANDDTKMKRRVLLKRSFWIALVSLILLGGLCVGILFERGGDSTTTVESSTVTTSDATTEGGDSGGGSGNGSGGGGSNDGGGSGNRPSPGNRPSGGNNNNGNGSCIEPPFDEQPIIVAFFNALPDYTLESLQDADSIPSMAMATVVNRANCDVDITNEEALANELEGLLFMFARRIFNLYTGLAAWAPDVTFEAQGITAVKANLIGSLPMELNGLFFPQLAILDLTGNSLTGSIPYTLGDFSDDTMLHMSLADNALNSTIPSEFGLLHSLEYLDLSGNELLHGAIPSELGQLTNLRFLGLSTTSLEGTVPKALCDLAGTSDGGSNNVTTAFLVLEVDCDKVVCSCSCICSNIN